MYTCGNSSRIALENWKNQIRSLPSYPTSFPFDFLKRVESSQASCLSHFPLSFHPKKNVPTNKGRTIRKISQQQKQIQVKEHSIKTTKKQTGNPPKSLLIYKFTTPKLSPPIAYYHFHHHFEVPANHHVVDPAPLRTLQCHPEGCQKPNRNGNGKGRFQSFSNPQQRKLHPCLKHLRICYINSLL